MGLAVNRILGVGDGNGVFEGCGVLVGWGVLEGCGNGVLLGCGDGVLEGCGVLVGWGVLVAVGDVAGVEELPGVDVASGNITVGVAVLPGGWGVLPEPGCDVTVGSCVTVADGVGDGVLDGVRLGLGVPVCALAVSVAAMTVCTIGGNV